ncbi:hypothetical protein KUTeg_012556 [Tegillarca granosa]|uniref:Uncharacterized protein n=1 Tax=Tegillarca granosa TaxID=220873 RepID=A0ABQ9F3E2_TEGGR|nr:hypothetical protein KUTeg_012556 [Tegillarca granosa]
MRKLSALQVNLTVAVKIIEIDKSVPVDMRGTITRKQTLTVADATGSIQLAIWKDMVDTFQKEQSIKFSDVSVRLFSNTKSLTTTMTSKATTLDDIGKVKNQINVDDELLKVGKFNTLCFTAISNVQTAKEKLQNQQMKNFRCPNCHMKQLTAELHKNIYANLNFMSHGSVEKLTMFNSTLATFLTVCNKSKLLDDIDGLEEFLLEIENVKIKYSKDKIIQRIWMVTSTCSSPNNPTADAPSAKTSKASGDANF